MLKQSDDPRAICRALLEEGKLIPFVGSGMSARFGFPAWEGLIAIIAEELGWDADVFALSGNFLQLAEYYQATKGSIGPLRSRLDKMFTASNTEIQESRGHESLVALNFPLIYTTNYEDMIERAFSIHGSKYHKTCHAISSIDNFQEMNSDDVQLIKFHGTFSDDESLVITESQYFERLEFESPLDLKLRADMLGKTLLFLGYSFSDLNLRLMLYKLMKLRRLHKRPNTTPIAIMTGSSFTPIQRELLSRWEVLVIELDPVDRVKGLDDFLGSLSS